MNKYSLLQSWKFPPTISVVDVDGRVVATGHYPHATGQDDFEDVRNAIGFPYKDRPAIIAGIKQMEAEYQLMVTAMNNHTKLVEALQSTRNLLPMCSCDNGVHSPSGQSEGEHWLQQLKEQIDALLANMKGGTK